MADREFDYVIVGAGSAGCTLAARLTEDAGVRVLLVEAGGRDRDPLIHLPLGWGRILQRRLHDWGYETEPDPATGNRAMECMRGKVLGGSSSVNAMAYVRGHRSDYDRWAAGGAAGWSYGDVLPYFRRQESWEEGASTYRGGSGPVTTRRSRYADPLIDAYVEAAGRAGLPYNPDYNAAEQFGVARMQKTVRNGRRASTASAYLRPVLSRPNLALRVNTLAHRVVIENGRATGVVLSSGGAVETVRAAREVILCGGAINSPQLLMLSGIGDPEALARHGIPVAAARRAVGRNLQDHVAALVMYGRHGSGPVHRHMRIDRLAVAIGRAMVLGTGFAADLPGGLTAFARTDPALAVPDTQMLFIAGPLGAAPYWPGQAGFADSFSCRIVLLRPESRGEIALRSADPAAPPLIRQRLLATDKDWATMRRAVALFRDIGRQAPLAAFSAGEIGPLASATADADIERVVRGTAVTAHHPCGSCRMGAADDETSVVDPELRVIGVESLRVIDASVFPDLVGGNINAPVIMIAERAADLIRGRVAVAPAAITAARAEPVPVAS
ncbi:GMC family oxidoreductase N-terminal domain-containing protein [Rhodoplanes sp. TEM]|uniref:GMC family oxidoreductase N-terminal domain-containing protein n=1 Tax=Rhodoplanes tepidamans TaxID=200616 RepID=A0ABT5JD67_RHOTP|nr:MULTISPECIES: GMC family oxidoreductase N-terminal domain-containing protein [Rhodoplanes]MDC7787448.1 GMC family oxidoreductase N-terminal domain-containing protein [Rhodoplanes tepidamans]MDC7986357.1 GMC family oxidoreductase N-terminal domain-containing protein [Rhodoplanes sp. TEM]MDQ0358066.1 choline dehydrogenase/4-pyridoxate dehydrogenase [Rhodoplanes tepidamans]